MQTLFLSFLGKIVEFIFFVPFALIGLIGHLFPSCANVGFISVFAALAENTEKALEWAWPILRYIPWIFCANFLSACLLYLLFKWLHAHFHAIVGLFMRFWVFIVIFYLIAGTVNIFVNLGYLDDPAFTEVFGTSSTVNGAVGEGFAGGGGGSW